jgi:3-hydroxyacyl-[acyl-carrier-protein] dehydratase
MSEGLASALAKLPHGPEFRFLDRLIELDPGKRGVGEYTVRGDEPFLRGHFPGDPLMPGVLLMEAAAQLAGVVAQCDPSVPPLKDLKLTAVQGAKITGSARPGTTLRMETLITGRLGGLVQAEGSVWVAEHRILHARLTLSGNPPQPV